MPGKIRRGISEATTRGLLPQDRPFTATPSMSESGTIRNLSCRPAIFEVASSLPAACQCVDLHVVQAYDLPHNRTRSTS